MSEDHEDEGFGKRLGTAIGHSCRDIKSEEDRRRNVGVMA